MTSPASAFLSPTPLSALSFAPVPGRGMQAGLAPADRFPVRWLPSLGVWEVDARPHGRIRAVLFPGSTSALKLVHREWAEEIRKAILRDIERGVAERAAVSPYLPREGSLEKWAERWLEHLGDQVAAGDRSPTYIRRLRDFVAHDWRPLYGQGIHAIGLLELDDFVRQLRRQGKSATTIVHVLASLRTCMRWIAKRSAGTYAAPEFPELHRSRYEPRILEPAEQDAVLAAIPEAKRGAFLALADLMIRPGEVRAANVEDYDFRETELSVRHAMKGLTHKAPRGDTKSRDRRLLVVTTRLAAWLEQQVGPEARLKGTGPLFSNPDGREAGGRFSYYTLADRWREACEAAGIPPVGLYAGTKHSTATWLRRAGLSLDELGLAMGHSWATREKRVTEGYARPPRLANANTVRLLDGRGR